MFYSFKINYYKLCIAALVVFLGALIGINLLSTVPCPDCKAITTIAQGETAIGEKSVYLTFDDGPSPTTEAILDVLDVEKVPATFFVIADENTIPYMNLVTRAHESGSLIALHTASHKYQQIYKSAENFWADIEELKTELAKHIPISPKCLRFPGGSTNTVSKKYGSANIMETLKAQALEKGYKYYDWNICVNDSVGSKKSSGEIVSTATKTGGKSTCVILFHDSKQNKSTAKALPEIIKWYKNAGYTFKTIDALA